MRLSLPLLLSLCLAPVAAVVAEDCCGNDINVVALRDFEAVTEFVNTKRSIPLDEKLCNLNISGDVRTLWAHTKEDLRCWQQRGNNAVLIDDLLVPYGTNDFNVEFNLYVDYVSDHSWAVVWLAFDNVAGISRTTRRCAANNLGIMGGSGDCDGLCMRKAYIGYNVIADGDTRLDIEVGRRPLWTVFDSRVEFYSRFDGALLRVAQHVPCVGDAYFNGGAFVIDERVNHFGYVGEVGLLDIGNWGFDVKYSYIDWSHAERNRCDVENFLGRSYQVSQLLLRYNLAPDLLCLKTQFYAAGLVNHAAPKDFFDVIVVQENKENPFGVKFFEVTGRQNLGWYAGVLFGEVCHAGDWSLDINYQYVEAFVIPDCDMSGIGNGNAAGYGIVAATSYENMLGNGNYRGWRFEGLYALTDNLSIDTVLQFSRQIDDKIGGKHSFSQFLIQGIYAF